MKTGIQTTSLGVLAFSIPVFLLTSSCQKQQVSDQTISPCSDFNNRQTVEEVYDETEAYDMGLYSSGTNCTFSWKITAASVCENGPLELSASATIIQDTSVKVSIGYMFERAQQEKILTVNRSSAYSCTLNKQSVMVEDIYNTVSHVNNCTTCQGSRPSPVDLYLKISFPSTGYADLDRQKLHNMIKKVSLKMIYVYYHS